MAVSCLPLDARGLGEQRLAAFFCGATASSVESTTFAVLPLPDAHEAISNDVRNDHDYLYDQRLDLVSGWSPTRPACI
jgi:hypothetical protein